MIVAWGNQLGELVVREIKYLYPEDCYLEGVPRCLEIVGVIVKIIFERKYVLVCGIGCRVTPNQYKIWCVLSFTAFTLFLHLC